MVQNETPPIEELTGDLKLSPVERRIVESLADEAVTTFEHDADAVRYFEQQLSTRYPDIWRSVSRQAGLTTTAA